METFSALLPICAGNSSVPGEFPAERPVTQSFDALFDLCLCKQLSKQWWGWWFETLSLPLWRHCNAPFYYQIWNEVMAWISKYNYKWVILTRLNHGAPTGARNSSLGHPNMAQASLGKNFPKVIPSLLHVFNGWYLQRLVIWCVSLSRPHNIWCKRRHITRRRGDISSRDARISTFV